MRFKVQTLFLFKYRLALDIWQKKRKNFSVWANLSVGGSFKVSRDFQATFRDIERCQTTKKKEKTKHDGIKLLNLINQNHLESVNMV